MPRLRIAHGDLEDLGRVVSVEELQRCVSKFNMRAGLGFVTYHSARVLRNEPVKPLSLANTFNLPLLAKAFLLLGQPEGGAFISEGDGDSLLRAVNADFRRGETD